MDSDDINMRVRELESLIAEEDRKRIGFRVRYGFISTLVKQYLIREFH